MDASRQIGKEIAQKLNAGEDPTGQRGRDRVDASDAAKRKWVPRYVGRYQVDRSGNVYSTVGAVHRQLKPMPKGKCGHLRVILYPSAGVKKTEFVHRLVLEAFVGACPGGMMCRHLDGNPRNNFVDNLRWGTMKENAQDAKLHGTNRLGESNGAARLTVSAVKEIRDLLSEGVSQRIIAARFGVHQTTVKNINIGRTWANV